MACHEINMAFMGLDLRDPVSFQAETSGHNHDSLPKKAIVTYQFPANDWRPGVKLVWYDGNLIPPIPANMETDRLVDESSGGLIVGEEATIITNTYQ